MRTLKITIFTNTSATRLSGNELVSKQMVQFLYGRKDCDPITKKKIRKVTYNKPLYYGRPGP